MSLTSHKRISPPELVYSFEQRQQSSTLSELLKCDVKLNLLIQPFFVMLVLCSHTTTCYLFRRPLFPRTYKTCALFCTISVSSEHHCHRITQSIDHRVMQQSRTNFTLRILFVFEIECFQSIINLCFSMAILPNYLQSIWFMQLMLSQCLPNVWQPKLTHIVTDSKYCFSLMVTIVTGALGFPTSHFHLFTILEMLSLSVQPIPFSSITRRSTLQPAEPVERFC